MAPAKQKPLRDAARTRARILAAANQVFSTSGFGHAGVREIAKIAGINAALINRYFGGKDRLFQIVMEQCVTGLPWSAPGPHFGRDLVRLFLDESSGRNPLRMVVLASADPDGQRMTMEILERHALKPLAQRLGPPNGAARAGRVLAICVGFFTWRILLPLPHMSGKLDKDTRRWLEDALQQASES